MLGICADTKAAVARPISESLLGQAEGWTNPRPEGGGHLAVRHVQAGPTATQQARLIVPSGRQIRRSGENRPVGEFSASAESLGGPGAHVVRRGAESVDCRRTTIPAPYVITADAITHTRRNQNNFVLARAGIMSSIPAINVA